MPTRLLSRLLSRLGPLALALLLAGCASPAVEIEAVQLGQTWVFVYAQPPDFVMDALHGGAAEIAGGCLEVGEAVVVWREEQLDAVESLVAAVEAGEAPEVQLGGGASYDAVEGGGSLPEVVAAHCSPSLLWSASGEAFTVQDGG